MHTIFHIQSIIGLLTFKLQKVRFTKNANGMNTRRAFSVTFGYELIISGQNSVNDFSSNIIMLSLLHLNPSGAAKIPVMCKDVNHYTVSVWLKINSLVFFFLLTGIININSRYLLVMCSA